MLRVDCVITDGFKTVLSSPSLWGLDEEGRETAQEILKADSRITNSLTNAIIWVCKHLHDSLGNVDTVARVVLRAEAHCPERLSLLPLVLPARLVNDNVVDFDTEIAELEVMLLLVYSMFFASPGASGSLNKRVYDHRRHVSRIPSFVGWDTLTMVALYAGLPDGWPIQKIPSQLKPYALCAATTSVLCPLTGAFNPDHGRAVIWHPDNELQRLNDRVSR